MHASGVYGHTVNFMTFWGSLLSAHFHLKLFKILYVLLAGILREKQTAKQ